MNNFMLQRSDFQCCGRGKAADIMGIACNQPPKMKITEPGI
jgi:hypothetical protein